MAIFEIPTRNDIFIYNFQVTLEDVTYTKRIHFNARMNRWISAVPDILEPIPLLNGQDLLIQHHYIEELPPGELKVVDLDRLNRDAEREIFSDRVLIGYKESTT